MKLIDAFLIIVTVFFLVGALVFTVVMVTQARERAASSSTAPTEVVTGSGTITRSEIALPQPAETFEPVTILAVGDIMLGRFVQTLMEQNGEDYPFEKTGDLFADHDVVLANLEGPIIDGAKTSNDSLIFRFQEYTAPLLAQSGITHVSLANNHTLNLGQTGLDNTRSVLLSEAITSFGDPVRDGEEVVTETIGTTSIAWVGANAAARSIDADAVTQAIQSQTADVVAVVVHWGNEYQHTPSSQQVNLARTWIDAGADMIIGHHPHVIQTVELYNDHLIFYSLGNFIFDQYFSQDTEEMLAARITIDEDTFTYELIPLTSSRTQPQVADEKTTQDILTKLASWSDASIRGTIQDAKFILQREP